MRSRNIKPGLFRNETLGSADPLYTLLFEGLWCAADREGRLKDRPLRLCAEVFPYRRNITAKRMDKMLQWLHDEKFIVRYEVAGERYIQVTEFRKHQNPHKNEAPSQIPSLSSSEHGASNGTSTGQAPKPNAPKTERLGLIPDSLIPDSLIPCNGTPSNGASAHRQGSPEKDRYPPDFDHHAEFKRRVLDRYPKTTHVVNEIVAQQHCMTLIDREGLTWEDIGDIVERFAKYVRAGGRSGPRYVEAPQSLLSPSGTLWKQPFDPPPSDADVRLESNLDAAAQAKRELLEESRR